MAIGLTLFLLDPVLILWRRHRRGAPLGQAHREHLYQQLVKAEEPHARVALMLAGAGALLSAVGWATYRFEAMAWGGVGVGALVFAAERFAANARSRSVR